MTRGGTDWRLNGLIHTTTWVCAACGKIWQGTNEDAPDSSCSTWGVLCYTNSIVINPKTGCAVSAVAAKE